MADRLTPAVKEGAASARAIDTQEAQQEQQFQSWQGNRTEAGKAFSGAPSLDQAVVPPQEVVAAQQQAEIAHTAQAVFDPIGALREQAESQKKEISLDTLTKKEKDKILQSFIRSRKIAKNHYESVVEPEIRRRMEIYEATAEHYDKVFPQLSKLIRWTSKDVKTSCEWILAGLIDAFTGSEDPLSIKGVNIEDDGRAEKIQQLLRYQLDKKNRYFQFCKSELTNALSINFGVAKVWWKREEKHNPMEMMLDINDSDAVIALMEAAATGKIEIKKMDDIEGTPDFLDVGYDEIKIKANHPVLECLPASELRYTPDAPDIQQCKFVAQRKIVRGDYLKRKEIDGIYKNIDKALEEYDKGDTNATVLDQDLDLERSEKNNRPDDDDKASKEVELYEAYLKVDYNNDGVFENLIVHAVGDNLIRVAENDFEFPPFFICSAEPDPNAVFNKDSFADSLEQQQDLKTAMIRQIIVNAAKNNSPRYFVNEQKTDMDALISNEEIIGTMGNPAESIFIPPSLPLSSISMEIVNYAQTELEAQSGSTRYNQGLDSSSLNKTATGITAVLGASEKRNKMMARSIAENFFIPIYKFLILLNQKYLEEEQMVRLTNENVSIRKEDLDIDYDLEVNVGQGAGTKEAQIQYYMYIIQSLYPILQNQNIVNAKSWYNIVCKLLEQLGLRNVSQYLMDPDSQEAKQLAEQAAQAAIEQRAQAMQDSIQLAIAKSSVPRVSVDLEKLPADAQQQFLLKNLGIETTERNIMEHEVIVDAQ